MEASELSSPPLVSVLATCGSEVYFAFHQKIYLKLKKSSWQTFIQNWHIFTQ